MFQFCVSKFPWSHVVLFCNIFSSFVCVDIVPVCYSIMMKIIYEIEFAFYLPVIYTDSLSTHILLPFVLLSTVNSHLCPPSLLLLPLSIFTFEITIFTFKIFSLEPLDIF